MTYGSQTWSLSNIEKSSRPTCQCANERRFYHVLFNLQVEKFNTNKGLSTELLNSTQELLTTRNNIQRLMKKCVGLATQLESAVAAGAGRLKQPAILDAR